MTQRCATPKVLHAFNPQLIYLSMSGFATKGPELAGLAAWEAIIAASPLCLASAYAASFGTMSVLFALVARDKIGGDHIEVPVASALFEGLDYNHAQIENYPDCYKSPRELELDSHSATVEFCNLGFAEVSEFLGPFYSTYQ